MQPDFLFGADGRKDPSRSVETSIKFHSAVVDSFARCFHWDRGLSGDRDMKLRFGYHSYTVHICCNYLYIDTDGYGYICSNVGVCINNVIYIYIDNLISISNSERYTDETPMEIKAEFLVLCALLAVT